MALPATDLFNDTNQDVALVGWTQQESPDTVKQDGLGLAYINAGTDEHVFWPIATDVFGNDQYSSVILDAISGVARAAVRAKDTTPTTLDYYAATSDGDIVLCLNGTISTLLNTATTFAAGDTLRCEVVGTRIEGFKNGVSFGSVTDSTLTSGQAGFGGTGNATGTWFRSWTGGNMGGGFVVGSTGTRRVGNATGPYDQRGFLKQRVWDFTVIAVIAITGSGSLELAPTFAYSGTSTQAESGTGSLAIASPAYSGTVTQTITGTGSLAIPSPIYSGTVVQTESGTGSMAIGPPQFSGTVTQAETGTGSLAIPAPAFNGTVVQTESGSGSLAIASPVFGGTVVQTESGAGSLAIGSPAFSGTVVQTESGTGTLPISVALSGTGTSGNTVTGTGSVALAQPAYSGTVVQTESGSGSLAVASPAFSGTVSQSETGTGSLAIAAPSISGTGLNTSPIVQGKYKPEHDSALIDVTASTGFGAEHTSALLNIGNATGFSIEHNSALKDIKDAGV